MVEREETKERWGLGLEAPDHPQEPWVKLTVRDELVNSLIHLTLKFFTRTAWHQSPTRTHFKPTDGARENPRKADRALSPRVLNITQRPLSDVPRWGLNTEEPAHRGLKRDLTHVPCTAKSQITCWCLWTAAGWVEVYPTWRQSAVVKAFPGEIIPWFASRH